MFNARPFLPLLLALGLLWGACGRSAPESSPQAPTATTPGQVAPEDPQAKVQDIRELLTITKSNDLGDKVLESVISNYKRNLPKVPESFWEELRSSAQPNDLIEQIIPIYEDHYTHAEIKGLIAYYKSPLGQKVLLSLPKITQESMQVSQKWGMGINNSITQKLKTRGYLEPTEEDAQGHDHANE